MFFVTFIYYPFRKRFLIQNLSFSFTGSVQEEKFDNSGAKSQKNTCAVWRKLL